MKLADIKVGDEVERNLCGAVMRLKVTEITDKLIRCSHWDFNKVTGGEVDEDLGWDGEITGAGRLRSGSLLQVEETGYGG